MLLAWQVTLCCQTPPATKYCPLVLFPSASRLRNVLIADQRSTMQLNPRAYLAGSVAYRALQWFKPPRVTAADVLNNRPRDRQVLYSIEDVRAPDVSACWAQNARET